LDTLLQDEEKYPDQEPIDLNDLIESANDYIVFFAAKIVEGYSRGWARGWAQHAWIGESENRWLRNAYFEARRENKDQVIEDLKLFCKIQNADEFFTRHFIYLMGEGEGNATPNAEVQAESYSRIFKEQIAKGKTEVFSHMYADLMAGEVYSELGCYAEAAEYEKALLEGNSENYAASFAFKMAEYIANYCSSYEEALKNRYGLVEEERKRLEKIFGHLKSNRNGQN
jgi:hypothetical protein